MEKLRLLLIFFAVRFLGYVWPWAAARWALQLFSSPQRFARPVWEEQLIANSERRVFSNGVHGFMWGKTGPIVLLLHGWRGRGAQLAKLAEPLIKTGHRVIAIDGPAHGDSPGHRTNIHFFARALIEIGRELGEVKCVVAHSFGAGATILALGEGLQAKSAVIVASPSDLNVVMSFFVKRMTLNARVAKSFQLQLEKWAGAKISELNIISVADRLLVPALIVHDPEDQDVAFKNAEKIAEHWSGARLLVLHGVGHFRILKAPAFIDAVVEFLSTI